MEAKQLLVLVDLVGVEVQALQLGQLVDVLKVLNHVVADIKDLQV